VCPTCRGIGRVGSEQSLPDPAGGPDVCPTCAGNGTVATPTPRIGLEGASRLPYVRWGVDRRGRQYCRRPRRIA